MAALPKETTRTHRHTVEVSMTDIVRGLRAIGIDLTGHQGLPLDTDSGKAVGGLNFTWESRETIGVKATR